MLSLGFEVLPRGIEVNLDAAKQKTVCFNLALQIPWDDLAQAVTSALEPARVGLASHSSSLGLDGAAKATALNNERSEFQKISSSSLADLEGPRKVELRKAPLKSEADNPARLRRAVQQGNLGTVRRFIRDKEAEFLEIVSAPSNLIPLALQSKCRLEMIKLLLQGRCSVNSPCEDGRSPLHCAVAEVDTCAPIAVRLLLCSRANHLQQDRNGLTPVDYLKSCEGFPDVSSNVKQIMSDLVEGPTQEVAVIENKQVLSACFANPRCNMVAFQTESTVGVYDLETSSVTVKKVLSKSKASGIRSMAVNPKTGCIAALIEMTGDSPSEVVMMWPHGEIEVEQPLQWCIQDGASGSKAKRLPPTIACSRSDAPPIIACRSSGGAILAWRLHSSCAQLSSEIILAEDDGGPLALSFGGNWIAIDSGSDVQVWTLNAEGEASDASPKSVASIDRTCTALAVVEDSSPSSCLLAVAGTEASSGAQVFRVQLDGSCEMVHHVAQPHSCFRMLRFCDRDCDALLSVLADGLLTLSRLSDGTSKCFFDDGSLQSVDISPDQNLMVSALQNCFRVFKVREEVVQ